MKHPLTVRKDDEPIYREAARLINERLITYQTKYRAAQLPQEFILSFAAVDIAARYVRLQRQTSTQPVEDALRDLTGQLQDFLREGDV